jgi:UDP-glucose/GDP-mannose dehydrogenase family, NAD binding domain
MPRNRFAVVSNPEFLREGAAIEDFKQPERVIGVEDDERARLVIAKIYEPLSLFRAPASSGRSRATPPRSKRASSTVYRTKRRFVLGNLEAALSEEPPRSKPQALGQGGSPAGGNGLSSLRGPLFAGSAAIPCQNKGTTPQKRSTEP